MIVACAYERPNEEVLADIFLAVPASHITGNM